MKTTEPIAAKAVTEPRQTRGAASLEDHRAARAGTLEDARRISPGLLLMDVTRAARRWTKGVRKSEIDTVASESVLRLMVRQLCRETPELRGELARLTCERERELMAERGGRLPLIRDWYRDAYGAARTGDNRSELALSEMRNAISAVVKNRARWSETPLAEDLELSLDADSPVAQLAAKETLETERGSELLPDASAQELASALGMPLNAGRTIERIVSSWSAREAAAVWNVSESRAEKSQSAGLSYLRSSRGWQDPDVMRNALWAARAVLRAESRAALKTELAALVRENRYQSARALRGELAAVSLELAESARRAAIHWHGLQLTSPSWQELAQRSAALWIDAAKLRGYGELRGGALASVPRGRLANPAPRSGAKLNRWSGKTAADALETERQSIRRTLDAGAERDALRAAAIAERQSGDWTLPASVELETVTRSALIESWRARELDNAYAASFKGQATPLRAMDAAQWQDIAARRELAAELEGTEDNE